MYMSEIDHKRDVNQMLLFSTAEFGVERVLNRASIAKSFCGEFVTEIFSLTTTLFVNSLHQLVTIQSCPRNGFKNLCSTTEEWSWEDIHGITLPLLCESDRREWSTANTWVRMSWEWRYILCTTGTPPYMAPKFLSYLGSGGQSTAG